MADAHAEWERLLASAARLQELVPDAVLVGGSAAALHAAHRVSLDHDHVVADLRQRFEAVLHALEASDGWVTARTKRPVLTLGSLDGVETGIRQLIRRRPLETEELEVVGGGRLRAPTLQEMLRVKAWMVLVRNATRDYLDVAALSDQLGPDAARVAASLDDYYADQQGPGGMRVATQLAKQLAQPLPYDLDKVDLDSYRELASRWRRWDDVAETCRNLAVGILAAGTGTGA